MTDRVRSEDYTQFVRPTPEWFAAAKLGIFIHWGAYAVPAWAEPTGELGTMDPGVFFTRNPYAEWYANTIRIPGTPARAHHREVWGDRPYDDFLDDWRAEDFDAEALVRTLAATGARYIVPTSKHHDGIPLWDAPGTGGRNTVARGPRRDIVGELAAAARAAGLRYGLYYSGGLDWHFAPDLPPIVEVIDDGRRPRSREYATYAHAHAVSLIEQYAPDIFWNDIDWPDAGKSPGAHSLTDVLERLYAANPDAVVNDRFGDTHWDFRTGEYALQPVLKPGEMWEQNRGIGYSFGYNALEDERHLLSGPDAVRMFVDVVSRGGNLLLNVGPTAAGRLPDGQARTLAFLGEWNAAHGDAIFGTSVLAGDAPRETAGGWSRWTRRGADVFAFVDAGTTRLRGTSSLLDADSAVALDGSDVRATRDGDTLVLDVATRWSPAPVAVRFRSL